MSRLESPDDIRGYGEPADSLRRRRFRAVLVERPIEVRRSCLGKVRHPSKRHAAAEARRLLREEGQAVHPYKCGAGHWHIGHSAGSLRQLGEKLRDIRLTAGVNIDDFSLYADCSVQAVGRYERGDVIVPLAIVERYRALENLERAL